MSSVQTTLQQLIALEPVKTWSLIVTLLGDMSEPQLSGKEMAYLFGHVGLKPETLRVAIHRLKKDGWIDTRKTGREVSYRLSASGISTTKAAYSDVYRCDVKYNANWKLVLVESDDTLEDKGAQAIRLLKRIYLLPSSSAIESSSALDFDIQNRKIPEWIVERLIPAGVIDIAAELSAVAESVIKDQQTLEAQQSLGAIDRAALRLLILHRWRKMALRESTWAHIALFPDGAMAQCHRHMTQLLAELPRLDAQQFAVVR